MLSTSDLAFLTQFLKNLRMVTLGLSCASCRPEPSGLDVSLGLKACH